MAAADNEFMRKPGLVAIGLLACGIMLLTACSPALNWRTVQLQDAPLQILLPCKPQTQTRAVELGLGTVQMSMVGCEADGRLFAVTHFLLTDPTRAGEAMAYWQKAVLAQLPAQGAPEAAPLKADMQWIPKQALSLPQSGHLAFAGIGPQGQHVMGDGLWFAQMEGSSARLYHAVIYGNKDPKVVEMFFPGVKLQ